MVLPCSVYISPNRGAAVSVKILIVDDHGVVRVGIRRLVESRREWEVCGEAADGLEGVRLAADLNPDAIVMDVTMPVMGGLAAAAEIARLNPAAKILIFTVHDSPTLAKFAQRSGAHGLVVKSRASTDLLTALDQLLAGRTFFGPAEPKTTHAANDSRSGRHIGHLA
jgi:two-component system, NarL family, invasion response regulator UvrY